MRVMVHISLFLKKTAGYSGQSVLPEDISIQFYIRLFNFQGLLGFSINC